MIRKIQSSEYLRRMDNMTAGEKGEYQKRVGEWLDKQSILLIPKIQDSLSVFQNAVQCSILWNDAECKAWCEGAQLLTALAGKADTWLPDMLYAKSAKRSIKQMIKNLSSVFSASKENGGNGRMVGGAAKEKGYGNAAQARPEVEVTKEEPADGTGRATQAVAANPAVSQQGTQLKPVPVRPKHIDQYVHLLPESTQKKAATVQGLLRELDVARENMRLLMNDPKSKSDSRAQWAKMATTLDAKVKAIYRELDAEWEKLVQSGRVTVDDLGNAHVVDAPADGSPTETADTASSQEQKTELTSEQKAQIKSLRSWLRDTRGPKEAGEKHDAYITRWKEKYQEMVELGGKDTVTEAVEKAAELYGIELSN